ncbi:MAG TPA: sodium-dependent transporter [Pirellulales bacterium]|jgi:NSS family neurotransmitter:Na+ symporter
MSQQTAFSSRWALMFAMLSMAVGTGSIWRFPRVVATNGGGAFLLPWVIFLFIWSIPLIITEFALGRAMKAGPIGSLVRLVGPKFAWMGAWIILVASFIMFYYSVVTGWVLRYVVASISGELTRPNVDYQEFYDDFIASPWPIALHVICMLGVLLVIYRGVSAIERVTSILLPSLMVLVVILTVRAMMLPGSLRGLQFMFTPNSGKLGEQVSWFEALSNYKIWLEALTQNAWDTGSGWGLILAYAIYMRKSDDSSLNCFLLGIGNNVASLLSGVALLCTVFALMPEAEKQIVGASNAGLAFVWYPQLFVRMPAGGLFMILFFAALFMAAFTSLISMVELAVRGLQDMGFTRNRGLVIVGVVSLLGGVPSAMNIKLLDNQDWVWGTALIVSGMMFAFVVLKFGINQFRMRYVNLPVNQMTIGPWWNIVFGALIPLQGAILLAWFFWQTFPAKLAQDGSESTLAARFIEWLQPFAVLNTGTVLAQWAVLLVLLLAANRWMGAQAAAQPMPKEEA